MRGGNSGMGMRKHGKSGWKNGSGKSPKLRHGLKRDAEKNSAKPPKTTTRWASSVKDAIDG